MSDAGSDPRPFELADKAARQHAPATLRNREPIRAVLQEVLPASGLVLEIASGTGEHAACFAAAFPRLTWQPSDMAEAALASIAAWRAEAACANLLPPVRIDLESGDWPVDAVDALFCANMSHIAPWGATEGLFAGAARVLVRGGPLALYGPFIEEGVATAPSNLAFDRNLRERDPRWGLRLLGDVDELAARHGLRRVERHAMPANNLLLVYRA